VTDTNTYSRRVENSAYVNVQQPTSAHGQFTFHISTATEVPEKTQTRLKYLSMFAVLAGLAQLIAGCITFFEMGSGPRFGAWWAALFLWTLALVSYFPSNR
jgi:hypothetical protein